MIEKYTMIDLLNDEMNELIENLPQVKSLKTEIERLTEERNEYKGLYETMYRKWSDLSTKDLNCEKSREIAREYFNKNVELQKKVDELEKAIEKTYIERIKTLANTTGIEVE